MSFVMRTILAGAVFLLVTGFVLAVLVALSQLISG
jgi:hypothetical protein